MSSDTETQPQQTDPTVAETDPPKDEAPQKNPTTLPPQFSIWPPSNRTREAVTKRLIDTLTTPSVISRRYGTMTPDEASAMARQIEEESYGAANSGAAAEEDGMDVLQVYSKEISKRMLDAVKARNVNNAEVASGGASEEVSGIVEN